MIQSLSWTEILLMEGYSNTMKNIQMVDLQSQHEKIKNAVDQAIDVCITSAHFINGPQVKEFAGALSQYLDGVNVIPCANGTDALQIALMALNLRVGDEIILPAFTYVATAEVIGLLGLTPVVVDVNKDTFNIDLSAVAAAITDKTRAIVPVHLFGQVADMEGLLEIARKHELYIIEDVAQAIGAEYRFSDGSVKKAGTIGDIGCTSFFPSKNLGCYGDGGAIYTSSAELAGKIRMIANHGQEKKYIHKYIGVNSRLDSLQAAILNIKLKHLDSYTEERRRAAARYDEQLAEVKQLSVPFRASRSTHVFHQYTLIVNDGRRDELKQFLEQCGIPSMIYYPIPLNEQEAYRDIVRIVGDLQVTKELCKSVLSLPMHTELTPEQINFITDSIKRFFDNV